MILQPDHGIPNSYIGLLRDFTFKVRKDINYFEKKLSIILDLYILKWFCIILNPIVKTNESIDTQKKNLILKKAFNYLKNIENKKNYFMKTL